MNPSFTDLGIVIRLVDGGEADKYASLVTQEHGFVDFLAKGVRRPKSRKSGHLDLLNLVKFQVARGRSPQILTQVELISDFENLKSSLHFSRSAFYITEILNYILAQGQKDKQLFISLKNYFTKLNQLEYSQASRQLSTEFQLYLLKHLGYPLPKKIAPDSLISHFENIISRRLKTKQIKLK